MAEGIPHWDDDHETWDTLKLGNDILPGPWDIEDGAAKRVMDIKKAPGLDGATIKDQGYENGALTCVGQFATPEQWLEMQGIAARLRMTQKGKERKPVEISHPKASYLGITRVYITEVVVPKLDNGIMTATIRVLEYIEKPKKTKKTKAQAAADATDNEFFRGRFNAAREGQKGKNAFDNPGAQAEEQQRVLDQQKSDAEVVEEQRKANEDFYKEQEQGKIPKFNATSPQYSPKGG